MNPKSYSENVLKTESNNFEAIGDRFKDEKMIRLAHAFLGIASEISEIKSQIHQSEFEGVIDYVNLQEECGDVAWYLAVAIDALGVGGGENVWPDSHPNSLFQSLKNVAAISDEMSIDSGYLCDLLKKSLFYGKDLQVANIRDKIQRLTENVNALAIAVGSSLDKVMDQNIAKLRARYGEKFSQEAASNRDLKTERDVLEGK